MQLAQLLFSHDHINCGTHLLSLSFQSLPFSPIYAQKILAEVHVYISVIHEWWLSFSTLGFKEILHSNA